ncbi:MAG: hydrogenase nickel incorporation protein HypB [bacterium]|nr:hydrogenase nickel incorporation protein HypB [bacterium]
MPEIKVVRKVMEANDAVAAQTRELLKENGVYMFNIMGSPGSGKTALIEALLDIGFNGLKAAVIEGDIETTMDADRLSRFNIPIVQINTEPFGGDCSLAPNLVSQAIRDLPVDEIDVILLENVGNLVCPAEFDVGQNKRIVVISVTEGEEKPLKYPLMFRVSDIAVISKVDLVKILDYDMGKLSANINSINGTIEQYEISARNGEGIGKLRDRMIKQSKGS